ncbi:armadillo repeat-containing protein 4 [Caerostris extrusa]|uniref:Armadillo repeat-containing protein 4 n=1 Tax=Caerostris extrusa TaxID=172846 RepID=A0AAV4XLV9_CAEEX|nr:armadillo repeat-containing protein 4 [Caerostris extrusa]
MLKNHLAVVPSLMIWKIFTKKENCRSSFPNDYWQLLKSIKYLSYGRPLITTVALVTAAECDFQDPIMLKCLHDYRIALRHEIVYLGGVQSMVTLLGEVQIDLKQAAAEAIASVADFHKAWKAVRQAGGIPLLVDMIYVSQTLLFEDPSTLSEQLTSVVKAAEVAAETLCLICNCRKNRKEFLLSGALRGCQNILKTPHGAFYSKDQNLMQAAAQAAFKCAEGEESYRFFGKAGFIDKLYEIIQTSAFHTDSALMASVSGALWKCAENENNLKAHQALNAAPLMINYSPLSRKSAGILSRMSQLLHDESSN